MKSIIYLIAALFLIISCTKKKDNDLNKNKKMATPKFRTIHKDDQEINDAHDKAAETITTFLELVKTNKDSNAMAKLRFINPDKDDDKSIYIWLNSVVYHEKEKIFSGVFFEVPEDLKKWHKVGERLGFDYDDAFDWMLINNGSMKGGYTIRVTRDRLKTQKEKDEYDSYIGITSYEPID